MDSTHIGIHTAIEKKLSLAVIFSDYGLSFIFGLLIVRFMAGAPKDLDSLSIGMNKEKFKPTSLC